MPQQNTHHFLDGKGGIFTLKSFCLLFGEWCEGDGGVTEETRREGDSCPGSGEHGLSLDSLRWRFGSDCFIHLCPAMLSIRGQPFMVILQFFLSWADACVIVIPKCYKGEAAFCLTRPTG